MSIEKVVSVFFGLPKDSEPRVLLGVPRDRFDKLAIKNALRRRLAQLHVHPQGFTDEANDIRDYLTELAEQLEVHAPDSVSSQSSRTSELTPLDQAIIAALVSEGGWNKNSRSRLVSIASAYSITVGGLMRILEAFADAARTGSGPLSEKRRSEYKVNRQWATIPVKKSRMSVVDTFLSDTAKKYTPELSSPTPIMTLKLSVLFALLTIIAFVLSFQVLMSNDDSTNTQGLRPRQPTVVAAPSVMQESVLIDQYPTFKVDGIESGMLAYADKGLSQLEQLNILSESLEETISTSKAPSDSFVNRWSDAMDTFSNGWVFIDHQVLANAKSMIVKILLLAEYDPEFTHSLLDSFRAGNLPTSDASNLTQSVWNSGILASLSCEHRLNATIRSYIKKIQLDEVTGCEEIEAEIVALNYYTSILLSRTEFEDTAMEFWETWFVITNRILAVTGRADPFIYLTKEILHSNLDLLRESKTRKVLGRVIEETNWASSLPARDLACSLIQSQDENVFDIAILTTLYSQSNTITWYPNECLVSLESTLQTRQQIAQKLMQEWPVDSVERAAVWNLSIPTGFQPELFYEWESVLLSVLDASGTDVSKLAELRLLNEAAVAMWKGRPDIATHALSASKRFDLGTDSYFHPKQVMRDGAFETKYLKAGTDHFEQLEAVDTLYNTSDTDLGPDDADLLASVALSHRKSEVRIAATRVLVQQFPNGSNVAIALVNNFSKAKTNEQISSIIAHLSNVVLPDPHSPEWDLAARRAFVQHALTCGSKTLWEFDEVSSVLATSLLSEYLLLNPNVIQLSDEVDATQAISMVVDSWRQAIPPQYLSENNTAFNPAGVLQQYLLHQLQYYSLLESEESRWRSERNQITGLHEVITTLGEQGTIIEQLLFIEEAIAKHWVDLFRNVVVEYERRVAQ